MNINILMMMVVEAAAVCVCVRACVCLCGGGELSALLQHRRLHEPEDEILRWKKTHTNGRNNLFLTSFIL
jgi:hypothetical protein